MTEYARLLEAKDYFVEHMHKQREPVNLLLKLHGPNRSHCVFESVKDFEDFNPSDFVSPALEASTDGSLESPLIQYIQKKLVKRLPALEGTGWALRAQGNTYNLAVLHHAPELLCEVLEQGHGEAVRRICGLFFSFYVFLFL
jgi:hypothetical protein